MFRSIRIKNAKLTIFSIACFLIFLAVCLLMLRASPPDSVEVEGETVGLKIGSDEDIEAFITKCGYPVEGCVSDEDITVPKNWNAAYTDYNELQLDQGFDLRAYKGKPARKLVYALSDSDACVTILATDDRIIAADISPMNGEASRPLITETSHEENAE
ncbi:MAG: DUF4830 domain-containing protein [Ruminococcus sp.]|nr:DUF4830 domain-containing protein [Ruminococcus sp.]MBQ9515369.1 DUF4830 domain-containing protein [Ruminococcus sp.]